MAKKDVPPQSAQRSKTIHLGAQAVPILDPLDVPALAADVITEAREAGGVVALGFAAMRIDGDNGPAEAIVTARLRLPLGTAIALRNILDGILAGAMLPKGETH